MNSRFHRSCSLCIVCFLVVMVLFGRSATADTNFVQRLNETWAQHDAQALLEFVETSAATNPCLETITAQGLVYGFILGWGAASTNLFEQAKTRALTVDSSRYTEAEKAGIVRCVSFLQSSFVSIAELGGGTLSEATIPHTNAVAIAEMFQLCPDKPMFSDYVELFSALGTNSDPINSIGGTP